MTCIVHPAIQIFAAIGIAIFICGFVVLCCALWER